MAVIGRSTWSRAAVLAAVCVAGILAACDGGSSDPDDPSLTVTPTTATLDVGGTQQLTARNATGAVAWTTSDDGVASVLSTGYVTGVGPGEATITATDSRGSATATVTVRRAPALVLSQSSLAFAATAGGAEPAAQTVQVTNGGDGALGGLSVSGIVYPSGQPPGWLTATLGGTTAPTQLTVRATPGALAPGTYSGTITVAAASGNPQTVAVTLTVAAGASIVLSRTAVAMSAVVGASPAPETVQITNGGGGTLGGMSASIAYGAGQPTDWLATGLAVAGNSATLTLTPTTTALAAGTYTATVDVSATGASNSPQQVAVSLTVGTPPSIALSQASLAFAATVGGASPPAQTVAVTNGGGGTLGGLAATVVYPPTLLTGWLTTATLDATTAPATLTVRPTTGALAAGTYEATILVAAAGAPNSPQAIAVTFTVQPAAAPPSISLARTAVAISAPAGGANPAAETVAIANGGGGTLSGLSTSIAYGGGQPTGWLQATVDATTAPATLTLQAATGALAAGSYTATVQVAAAGASNSPRTVAVTFTVTGPALVVAPTSLEFTAPSGTQPAAKNLQVTASSGTLGGLAVLVAYQGPVGGWLFVSLSGPGTPASISVQPSAIVLAPGTYTATVNVVAPTASNTPQPVTVTYTVTSPPPTIVLGSANVSTNRPYGSGAGTQTNVAVTNGGSGSVTGLSRSISYGPGASGWLTASLDATTAPTTLRLTPNVGAVVGGMSPGTYTATVSVASAAAANSPQALVYTLTVLPPSLVADVFPIISAKCTGCHVPGLTPPFMNTAAAFRAGVVNVATTFRPPAYPLATAHPIRVVPSNAAASYLMDQLSRLPGAGPMPPVAAQALTASELAIVRAWINGGANP